MFLELPSWPTLNFAGDPGSCPFDTKKQGKPESKLTNKEVKENKEDIESTNKAEVRSSPFSIYNKYISRLYKQMINLCNHIFTWAIFFPHKQGKEMTRRPRARARRTEQLVAGDCEICHIHYDDRSKHVQTEHHLNFVGNDDNFLSLDTLINAGANVEAFLKLNRTKDIE